MSKEDETSRIPLPGLFLGKLELHKPAASDASLYEQGRFAIAEAEAAWMDVNKALALEGARIVQHGGSTDPKLLLKQWLEAMSEFNTAIQRLNEPLFNVIGMLHRMLAS